MDIKKLRMEIADDEALLTWETINMLTSLDELKKLNPDVEADKARIDALVWGYTFSANNMLNLDVRIKSNKALLGVA
jgi:hypothetical protein